MDEIQFGSNKFCGPSVVSALTGLNTDESALLYSKVTGRKVITSVMVEETEKVINLCGLLSNEVYIYRGMSLFTFISSNIDRPGKYLTGLQGHIVLTEITPDRKASIHDNHTVEPLDLSRSARLSQEVIYARKVNSEKKKSVDTIREEFKDLFSPSQKKAYTEASKKIQSFIIKKTCPKCGALLEEVERIDLGYEKLIKLKCGHVITEETLTSVGIDPYTLPTISGKTLMKFQVDGVKFAETSNVRCLIGDEQGLGKTVQALYLAKLHRKELFPVVGVLKKTILHQWFHMWREWVDKGLLIQIINSGKEIPLPGMDVYLISYDMLASKNFFEHTEFKTVIFDECQMIKNHLADRAKASQRLANQATHIIALSGTAIKNNAGEYFTILNILQPGRFPEYNSYLRTHCDVVGAKIGGLKKPAQFHELTKDFIIRRTKDEVFPDLPQTQRNFHHVELDPKLNKAYAEALSELDDILYRDEDEGSDMHILAIMNKMRRITGISKTLECVDWVEDFLDSCERKLVIFLHHHDVEYLLKQRISKALTDRGLLPCLSLTSSIQAFARDEMIKKFQSPEGPRILIASTLSSGEGLDGLQLVCSDMVILERQWNPANEEQVEGRLDRRIGQKNKVNITYMLASETIDDYFTELVEIKRSIMASTLDNKSIQWNQSSLLKELAHVLVNKKGKKWTLPK